MSIEKARKHLSRWGKDSLVVEHEVSSATVELAAQALNTEPGRIAKTLSFMVGESPILIVAAGDAKIDNAKYKHKFSAKAKMLTFWTFFISLPLLGDMVFTQFIFPMLDVESSEGTAAMFVWGTLMLVYGVIACIGLWRSAGRYTGPSHWALLAKACAVLGIGASAAYALMWYGSWMILASA